MKHYRVGIALVWYDNQILLVEHKAKNSAISLWKNQRGTFFTLPSGKYEESDQGCLKTTSIREAHEEAGVVLSAPVSFAYGVSFQDRKQGWDCRCEAYIFHQDTPDLQALQDPDNAILSAAYFSVNDAVTRLTSLQPAPMRDPAIAYIKNELNHIEWRYALNARNEYALL